MPELRYYIGSVSDNYYTTDFYTALEALCELRDNKSSGETITLCRAADPEASVVAVIAEIKITADSAYNLVRDTI